MFGEKKYPMVIAGIVGWWLLLHKKSREIFREQLKFVENSLEEVMETGGELQFLSVLNSSLSLNFRPTISGFILEMCFQDEAEASFFFEETIESLKLFDRSEIIEGFSDDQLNLLFALLLKETAVRLQKDKIIFDLPSSANFFRGVNNSNLTATPMQI